MSPFTRLELKRVWFLLGCSAASAILLWGAARYRASRITPPVTQFRFPTKELAALDRDLQARFAVVPDKDFGIERTYGYQHYLYNPQNQREKATINALKSQKTEAAFYLMSRALWLRSWDGWGYKPIQGPVHLTGKITLPLPRIVNFDTKSSYNQSTEPVVDQENGSDGSNRNESGLPTHLPNGTVVASPTPPLGAPTANALQEIGNRVFEMAEESPKTAQVGTTQQINDRWNVVAVPIRASKPACLPCHVYRPHPVNPNATSRTDVKVGDALGVAFYIYSIVDKQQKQAQAMRNFHTPKIEPVHSKSP